MVPEDNFLKIDINSSFSKKWVLKKREFPYPLFQSISYNNGVVTKQIYFSSTLSKSWVHIPDNIAGLVGGPQYY